MVVSMLIGHNSLTNLILHFPSFRSTVLVAEPGFFGMLDLKLRVRVPVKTYGEMILASNDDFLTKNLIDQSLPKKLAFS